MRIVILFALILILGSTPSARGQAFENHWHDGKAELDGYRLVVSRYGEERAGTAVMIFVTEPFRESTRVKADHPDQRPEDVFDVIKLNLVRDFQTGIYDYNTMVSVFSRTDDFSAVKTSFTSAEWCGHVYEEQIYRPGKVDGTLFSYFEGESGSYTLPYPEGGVMEDNLFIWLRGLKGDVVAPGRTRTVPFLPGTFADRLAHQKPAWTEAEISRRPRNETVLVPAGEFSTRVVDIQVKDGKHGTFYLENAYPHRIVKWELAPDVRGELTGTLRVPYWTLHDNGGESYLKDLGLK
jgi:hypothetical protein